MSKSAFTIGLERVINNPKVDFFGNGAVFRELQNATGMKAGDMIREIGHKSKAQSDSERSAKRLETFKERQTEILEK
jgi:hypothetical protein